MPPDPPTFCVCANVHTQVEVSLSQTNAILLLLDLRYPQSRILHVTRFPGALDTRIASNSYVVVLCHEFQSHCRVWSLYHWTFVCLFGPKDMGPKEPKSWGLCCRVSYSIYTTRQPISTNATISNSQLYNYMSWLLSLCTLNVLLITNNAISNYCLTFLILRVVYCQSCTARTYTHKARDCDACQDYYAHDLWPWDLCASS